jgi:flagella basal body P-ring formation protein FlgA
MTRLFLITLLMLAAGAAQAADIELRAQAKCTGTAITLGDIALLHGDDRAALAKLELVPAPAAGRSRTLKLREVQDLLTLQGVKLVDHQFCGATSVQVSGSGEAALTPVATKASRNVREQTTARVEKAIVRHLKQDADDRPAWEVAVELTDEQLQTLNNRSGEIFAQGGEAPWTGTQQFVLKVGTSKGVVSVPVTATVRLPDMVVVAKRPFRRGEVIRASDVSLAMPEESGEGEIALATRIEDVVGRETVRSLATGQPIEAGWVRKPIMVRRGEIVTVFARASNLVVRTQARAVDDGGQDDVVAVERLDNRQRFSARVVGVQELEVLVGGLRVTGATSK